MCAECPPAFGEPRQFVQRVECELGGQPEQQQREQRVSLRPRLDI